MAEDEININSCEIQDLITVPGTGHYTAKLIMAQMENNGEITRKEFFSSLVEGPIFHDVALHPAGRELKMQGFLTNPVTLQVQDKHFQMPVYVSPIGDEIILGFDFLLKKSAEIDVKNAILTINGTTVDMVSRDSEHSIQPSQESVYNMTASYDDVQIKMTDDEARTAGDTPPKADDTSRQTYEPNPYVVTAERGVHLKIPPKATIVPKPWRKIKHIIIASYFSMICLCVPGMFANKYAWEARRYKELGLHSEARVLAKNSVCCIYTALVIGLVMVVINIILALVLWT